MTPLLYEHFAIAKSLPEAERPWFWMRLGRLLGMRWRRR
jgi:hypothetical protein